MYCMDVGGYYMDTLYDIHFLPFTSKPDSKSQKDCYLTTTASVVYLFTNDILKGSDLFK
jgi:hypothetical protein